MGNKYNARKTYYGGYTFDSIAECNRYKELLLLLYNGEIGHLIVHPHFELFPAIKHDGKKLSAISYTADFQYREKGKIIVEDVKGMITRDASLRMNLFQRLHPEIDFRIIKKGK